MLQKIIQILFIYEWGSPLNFQLTIKAIFQKILKDLQRKLFIYIFNLGYKTFYYLGNTDPFQLLFIECL